MSFAGFSQRRLSSNLGIHCIHGVEQHYTVWCLYVCNAIFKKKITRLVHGAIAAFGFCLLSLYFLQQFKIEVLTTRFWLLIFR